MPASAKSDGKSAGAASRIGDAISKFGGKSTVATTTAAQQKRDASKRFNMLANANTPQHVKDKWEAICKLGKGKNKAKQDFSEVLAKDAGSWTDGYWQANFGEKHSHKNMNTAEWMLKSKAITDHGGGQAGKTAIDEAVAAGIYEERVIFNGKDKLGKPISIAQIRVKGEKSAQVHTTSLEEKVRVGCAATGDDFQRALSSGLCNHAAIDGRSIRTPKKLGVPAIKDRAPSVTSQMSKRPAAQKPAAQKPAAMKVIKTVKVKALKRPSAHGAPAAMKVSNTGMTEALKKKHDEEHEAQNDQLNKCLEKALSQLGAMEMKARKAQAQAKAAGGGSKLKEVHEQELGRVVSEIAILADRLKDVTILKTSSAFAPNKVDLLENSSKTIQEAKDIISVLTKTIAPKAASAGVSSVSRG